MMMSSISSINLKTVGHILAQNNLGSGTLLEDAGELRIFLDNEPKSVMAMHLVASQLEATTGRVVDVDLKSNLGPAELAQLERSGTVV
jgi:hypothetical protein